MSDKNAPLLSLFLISASMLTFEITLTRLFSVAQFYHFAFMIVSIALLGFGASGTILAIFPNLTQPIHLSYQPLRQSVSGLGLAMGISILAAYLFTNWVPFDSFSIAWDRKQAALLALHYLALALPFFFSGMAVGLLLAAFPSSAGQIYAINLFGSALGCILALAAPSWLGGEGTVMLCVGLSALSYFLSVIGRWSLGRFLGLALLFFSLVDLSLRLAGYSSLSLLDLRLSPYKSLSYVLQYPGSQIVYRRWNAISRVDVARSPSIHSLPGLSYRYLEPPPEEDGLLIDGDDLNPILRPGANLEFADYLPSAIAFRLRPQANVLILEPRGGLDILAALAGGATRITAVETNSLIISAAKHIYTHPQVNIAMESGRSFLRSTDQHFDIVLLTLSTSYHPVRSGAYSLAEDYRYTVQAFEDALARLNPQGLLVTMRWLQSPPSESLRTFALAVTALEGAGQDPGERIVAFRGYNTATFLVKNEPFTSDELSAIRAFTASRAFDLIYAPGIQAEETNLYNILPESTYYQAFISLLETQPRQAFYANYPYDVRPPTDDHPFFGHYFKWTQAGQVFAELGKTWQPFGGAGYFVILALLLLATLAATGLILLPTLIRLRQPSPQAGAPRHSSALALSLAYFGLIGFAYLLVEIPLLQRFILYLGHPAYAMAAVLFSLLSFSGLGSRWSGKIPVRLALAALVLLLLALPTALPVLFRGTLGLPLPYRLGLTGLALAPVGFLMGIPFPSGIRWLEQVGAREHIPWIWAMNGATSVVSSVLAALLALTFGFSVVFWIGSLGYAGAWGLMALRKTHPPG